MKNKFRLGTRGSCLALIQANRVKEMLKSCNIEAELVPITTMGDKITDRPLAEIGGKGLFSKEIEQALLKKEIDFSVHSLKDLETQLPDNLLLCCFLEREDPRDVFVSSSGKLFKNLPFLSKIGTSSPRRKTILKHYRDDLDVINIRGNVDTRLKKLDQGLCDGLILAYAGLKRLKLLERITEVFDVDFMLPAVGQGALAVECRRDDQRVIELFKLFNHTCTEICITAERSFLKECGGSCKTPIGGYAYFRDGALYLKALLASPDGQKIFFAEEKGTSPETLGYMVAKKLIVMARSAQ